MFGFNETATTEIYTYCHTLALHYALPILRLRTREVDVEFQMLVMRARQIEEARRVGTGLVDQILQRHEVAAAFAHAAARQRDELDQLHVQCIVAGGQRFDRRTHARDVTVMVDRKSTRLNSSH